jgi:hypothetical protein
MQLVDIDTLNEPHRYFQFSPDGSRTYAAPVIKLSNFPMNKAALFVTCGLLFVAVAFGLNFINVPPVATVTHRVVDEDGKPIKDAEVFLDFQKSFWASAHPRPFGRGSEDPVEGLTDARGVFTASGHSSSHMSNAVGKPGFYKTFPKPLEFRVNAVIMGHSLPWNPTVQVTLKRIVHPVPMFAKRVEIPFAATDIPVGFDLEAGDWVAPHGRGKVPDFLFTFTEVVRGPDDSDSDLLLKFPNADDGIQAVMASHAVGSELVLPRMAPEDGYLSEWKQHQYRRPKSGWSPPAEDMNYIFRVRSVSENGKVVHACYGKIHGEIIWTVSRYRPAELRFNYYLNPDTTRKLEFDRAHNLFVHLDILENPHEP